MQRAVDVASYVYNKYYKDVGYALLMHPRMLQEYLYMIQMEFLIKEDRLCFEDVFYAYKDGPVIKEVAKYGAALKSLDIWGDRVQGHDKELIDDRYNRLKGIRSVTAILNRIESYSAWKAAREGIPLNEDGGEIDINLMKQDAARIREVRQSKRVYKLVM